MATWGASFGEGLWGALDREAQDFQRRRKARKEQERQKRLAEEERLRLKNLEEEERLRQEELANQRALNLFQMQNQDAMPAYMGLSTGIGEQFVPVAMSQALKIAGVPNMTVGDHINALEAVKSKQAADALAKKEQLAEEDRKYTTNKRYYELRDLENKAHEYEELQALKPELERKKQEEEARKKKQEDRLFNAKLANIESQTLAHKAQANYYNNGGGRGSSKQQEDLDPEEQAFLAKREELKNKLNNLNSRIGRSKEASGVFEKGGSFDEAEAAIKKSADYVREYEKIQAEYDNNEAAYSKWKTNKAAGKKTSTSGIGVGFKTVKNMAEKANKNTVDFIEKQKRIAEHEKSQKDLEWARENRAIIDAYKKQRRAEMEQEKVNPIEAVKVPSSWDVPLLREAYQALKTPDGHKSKKELKKQKAIS